MRHVRRSAASVHVVPLFVAPFLEQPFSCNYSHGGPGARLYAHDYCSVVETSAGHLRDCTTLTQLRRRVATLNNTRLPTEEPTRLCYSFRIQRTDYDLSRATILAD